ncbi:tol-pal system-associated acyl-CoA thioesterase [Hydrocarboniclastica marina]|uniref:Tol-pal system-associated acyl-CoA thioesterase n=1 Tax=Hydrocarboniclastica marina TaxID=2259620 RepID=A0A4P7XIX4_9ALTE|nr:tol-pal system-associated acyl-CoA thioesterase [Hydrocarboniclastica marina]MAL98424.1 tol-pal system-associated acyl-CoA thioesterase [Alteromonadaceae bacterium]QCF25817.1 tol-pal system-associated acyl-CoA thioesterase [Hydrocarboniclastica marina]|tara:strand:+ start:1637 stop:2056 length:420 start_codon:yes stop_codon:yes gene_type:complete
MTDPAPPFTWPVRVYIEDTDAGGIVFYANYLKFMERARTEWARARGIAMRAGLGENISFVVHGLEIRYLRPARLDDQLWVSADVTRFGKTYMDFEQQVGLAGSGDVLVQARIKVACTNLLTGRPRAMPESLRAALERAG